MKLSEIKNVELSAAEILSQVKKAINVVSTVRGSRIFGCSTDIDNISFSVEFDFPEHLVKAAEVKAAGAPAVKKVTIDKSQDWKRGEFGATYTLYTVRELTMDEESKFDDEFRKMNINKDRFDEGQLTKAEARKMLADLHAGLDDPMTKAMFAGEHVTQSFRDKCRKLGVTPDQVREIADEE